jgi:acyl CoA:acetate/3-ketoacid CoA transferase alpha subunit
MAMSAAVTVAEVDEIVQPGEINPNCVVVPSLFVKRIVQVTEQPDFPRHLETDFQVKEEV